MDNEIHDKMTEKESPRERQARIGIESIKRNYRGDIAAQMVAVAFLQDSLDEDFPSDKETQKGK
jgi:hypothetical protein